MAPLRLLVVAGTALAWVLQRRPVAGSPQLAVALIVLLTAYAVAALAVTYRRPELLRGHPDLGAALDVAGCAAWVLVSGGRASPYLPLLFVGAVTAPLRLSPRYQLLPAAALAALYLALAAPGQGVGALYLLVSGGGLAAWSRAVDNLRRGMLRDQLTGSFGRDYALLQVESLLERDALPFAVALVDLDGFKAVNDTHGHLAGDQVLRECARRIQAVIRPSDVLARFGGDEFLVVCPEADLADGMAVAERIRAQVAGTRFPLRGDGRAARLSVSVGVAEASSGQSPTDLVQAADRGLYVAKGVRDRVSAAPASA